MRSEWVGTFKFVVPIFAFRILDFCRGSANAISMFTNHEK